MYAVCRLNMDKKIRLENFQHWLMLLLLSLLSLMVTHFWIVHLVSLITPKRIEPITWDVSHFEDILKENKVNFQNKR